MESLPGDLEPVGEIERRGRAESRRVAVPHLVRARAGRRDEPAHRDRLIAGPWILRHSGRVRFRPEADDRSAGATQSVAERGAESAVDLRRALEVEASP